MQPISRRLFLAGSVAVIVGSCSSDDASPAATSAPTAPGTTPAALTTIPAGTTLPTVTETAPATVGETVPPTDSEPAPTAPPTAPAVVLERDPFTLGVASGDPSAESVILWTRLAPDPLAGGGMPEEKVEVIWEMARDAEFADIEWTGLTYAEPAHGHSIHAVAEPGPGDWFFRFRVGNYTSPVGLTRLAPAADATVESVRFASASCQNYEDGYYIAHRDLAAQKPDFVVFLGDYIYEGGSQEIGVDGNVRSHGTPEVMTLDDYRNRYALYKRDPDLQAAHAACPWFSIWDDHEVENNYAGTLPQDPADAAIFPGRRRAAYQAWWEHQPVALDPPPATGEFRTYRAAGWGGLLSLALLDGRQYRSDQACGDVTLDTDAACPETFEPGRTMLGAEQEAWLIERLTTQTSVWRSIGNQVVFGDTTLNGAVLNYDQWDGYPEQRNRIVREINDNHVANVVVLTGDIHFAGTGTIRFGERGTGTPVGVEFVATSISSGGLIDPAVTEVLKGFPDVLDAELEHRGYILHTVTPARWTAEYRMVETVKQPDSAMFVHNTYVIEAGTNTVDFASA